MSKLGSKNGRATRVSSSTKYDAHHTVLSKTYGALADLRRELADSKSRVAEREEILRAFSACEDRQRSWLLLEDYFEKLSLSRKDFAGQEWWARVASAQGTSRLEQLALLFLRSNRPIPTELTPHANSDRLAEIDRAEHEARIVQELEHWLFPPAPTHLDAPRAWLRVCCTVQPASPYRGLCQLAVHFNLFRPRTGDKFRPLTEILELTQRSAHEQELFSPADWEFVQWLAETYRDNIPEGETVCLTGIQLLEWLAQWGQTGRLEIISSNGTGHPPPRPDPTVGRDSVEPDLLAPSLTRPPEPGPALKFIGQVADLVGL